MKQSNELEKNIWKAVAIGAFLIFTYYNFDGPITDTAFIFILKLCGVGGVIAGINLAVDTAYESEKPKE